MEWILSLPLQINPSEDILRLSDKGYNVDIIVPNSSGAFLIVKDIPYVNKSREVDTGVLVMELDMKGNEVAKNIRDHTALWVGEIPHDENGSRLESLIVTDEVMSITESLQTSCRFSRKIKTRQYHDYFEKVQVYEGQVAGPARKIKPEVTAQTYSKTEFTQNHSVFAYPETASSRSSITDLSGKLQIEKVAIIGLGGTGSYILDLLAKTPIRQIHLFDGDDFQQHNAFRAPGAANKECFEEDEFLKKVNYFKDIYTSMHSGITAHPYNVDEAKLDKLCQFNFIFLSVDSSPEKIKIVEYLENNNISFIDAGIGVKKRPSGGLFGLLRATTRTPEARESFSLREDVISVSSGEDALYDQNIQVADLNMLNAVLAVVKWKKLRGFYCDRDQEFNTTFRLDSNKIVNSDLKSQSKIK